MPRTSITAPVFVEGVAVEMSWADPTRNLMELIFDTVRQAVDDSGAAMSAIDSVVLSAHDLVDGRSLSSMVTAPAAGAYLRDEVRLSDDGAAALAVAMTRLEAGHNERSIVAAWGRVSEHDVTAVARALFDPIYSRPFGLTEIDVAAMRAQAWLQHHDPGPARRAYAERRMEAAARNPRAVQRSPQPGPDAPTPLAVDEQPRWADVVTALVVSREESAVRITGMGQSSEPYFIGDRRLLEMPALRDAVTGALAEADATFDDLDVIETDGMTSFDEAIGLEAMGLAQPGGGFDHLSSDRRCNPSGGSAAGYCAPAMGLVRVAESVLQLRGHAGAVQLDAARRALATGSSAVAAQTQTAIVLEAA
jgi:hypothetical protein